MTATLKSIAEVCGVSVRTVGRALNDSGYVKEGLREQILAEAAAQGYRPNRVAMSLRKQRSFEVAVIMSSVDELHMAKLAAFEGRLRAAGYATTVLMQGETDGDVSEALADLLARRPAGLAWFGGSDSWNRQVLEGATHHDVPYIIIGSALGHPSQADTVSIDRGQGIYEAIQYLAKRGRQRIAYLAAGRADAPQNRNRLEGYQRAIADLKLEPLYIATDRMVQDVWGAGRKAGHRFPTMDPLPDAVQGYSDELTLGFLAGLHDMGVRVPMDLALVGFDDRQCAAMAWPPLTTVMQPNREVGEAAADILLAKLAGEPAPETGWSRRLPTRLVIRGSA